MPAEKACYMASSDDEILTPDVLKEALETKGSFRDDEWD